MVQQSPSQVRCEDGGPLATILNSLISSCTPWRAKNPARETRRRSISSCARWDTKNAAGAALPAHEYAYDYSGLDTLM
jgi:hypothetical protein